jgi:hypothetical protein
MKDQRKELPIANQIREGLEEAILRAKGEITLKTTTLEVPDRAGGRGRRTVEAPAQKRDVPVRVRTDAQRLDRDRPELGTEGSKAITGCREADPGVSSEPVWLA